MYSDAYMYYTCNPYAGHVRRDSSDSGQRQPEPHTLPMDEKVRRFLEVLQGAYRRMLRAEAAPANA